MFDLFRQRATVLSAVRVGDLIDAEVAVPIPGLISVYCRVIVPVGETDAPEDWVRRAETCAQAALEATRWRLAAHAKEGDPE